MFTHPHHHHIPHEKHVTLRFGREELLYDIRNYCYVEGDIMERQDEHAKHQVFDVGEKGNIDRVTRVLDLAFSQCVDLCYPYTKKEVRACSGRDDELEETDEYVMTMRVPDGFSETTVTYMEKLIHELMVYKVMVDWMSITKPESKPAWQEKLDNTENEIRSVLNMRIKRTRRPMTPF